METIKMQLNSPITDEQWNIITDAELERSDEIEFTTPSGKKVMYAKVRHGKWIELNTESGIFLDFDEVKCSECGFVEYFNKGWARFKYCPNCGAKMDEVGE